MRRPARRDFDDVSGDRHMNSDFSELPADTSHPVSWRSIGPVRLQTGGELAAGVDGGRHQQQRRNEVEPHHVELCDGHHSVTKCWNSCAAAARVH